MRNTALILPSKHLNTSWVDFVFQFFVVEISSTLFDKAKQSKAKQNKAKHSGQGFYFR